MLYFALKLLTGARFHVFLGIPSLRSAPAKNQRIPEMIAGRILGRL